MAESSVNTYATTTANLAAGSPNVVSVVNDGTGQRQIVVLGKGDGTSGIVDGSTANPINIAVSALPLPSGAATSANQTNGNQLAQVISYADNITTGTIVANGGTVVTAVVAGNAGWTMAYQGTYSTGASLTMEVSFDGGTTYSSCRMLQGSSGILGYVVTIAAVVNSSSFFVADIPSGATNLRVRCSAWAAPTGTINITLSQSVERFSTPVATQAVTATVTGTISGLKTTNAAVPAATNLGVLPSVANAAKPSLTETFQTALSTDLNGNLRMRISDAAGNDRGVNVTSANALTIDGSAVTQPVSLATNTPTLQTGTNAIGTVGTTSAVVNVAQKTVSTTAVQLNASSTVPTNGIVVKALSSNAASIFVGGSGVTTSTGYELVAGESISFTCNLNTLYIISVASTTDKACYNVE